MRSKVARQIGPWGTGARLFVGALSLAWAINLGVHGTDALLGFVVFPLVVVSALALRGRHAAPLRAEGPGWHVFNILAFVVLISWQPTATLLLYGSSMWIAAWRGIGACEVFAVSNLIRGRDDRLGCPLFLPVDAIESRTTGRQLYCS